MRLAHAAGAPVTVRVGSEAAPVSSLRVTSTDRGVSVATEDGRLGIAVVEHLFAALGGLGIRSGVAISVEGGEVPLLDGGANELARALLVLELPRSRPSLRVTHGATLHSGDSTYVFEPRDGVELEVEVEFPGVGREAAHFDGNADTFVSEIAPARTFGYAAEEQQLRARGLARGAHPHSVLVLDDCGHAVPPSAPRQPLELARHKLLDLVGDLYLHGGPPLGRLVARRPGHRATHQLVALALAEGILERIFENPPGEG